MRITSFRANKARLIEKYESRFKLAGVQRLDGDLSVSCMYMRPGDHVGRHQATVPQLFMIVNGDGWVRGERGNRRRVRTGDAVLWETGEWHEAGSDDRMTALVIEFRRPLS